MSNWKLKIGAMYKFVPKENYPIAVWYDSKVPQWDIDAIPVCVDTLNHNDSLVILEQDSNYEKWYKFQKHKFIAFKVLTKNGIIGWINVHPADLRLMKK